MIIEEINQTILENAYSYLDYRQLIDALMAEHKTTGPNQEAWIVDYARLNIARMKKWEKTVSILATAKSELEKINSPQFWLTITEGWCGDAAQIVPVIEQLAKTQPLITHKMILRDEHTAIIDQFLTHGGRAIPITLIIDPSTKNVLAHWGPRPSGAQNIMNELKTNPNLKKEDLMEALHAWYAKDKTVQIQEEFMATVAKIIQ